MNANVVTPPYCFQDASHSCPITIFVFFPVLEIQTYEFLSKLFMSSIEFHFSTKLNRNSTYTTFFIITNYIISANLIQTI